MSLDTSNLWFHNFLMIPLLLVLIEISIWFLFFWCGDGSYDLSLSENWNYWQIATTSLKKRYQGKYASNDSSRPQVKRNNIVGILSMMMNHRPIKPLKLWTYHFTIKENKWSCGIMLYLHKGNYLYRIRLGSLRLNERLVYHGFCQKNITLLMVGSKLKFSFYFISCVILIFYMWTNV